MRKYNSETQGVRHRIAARRKWEVSRNEEEAKTRFESGRNTAVIDRPGCGALRFRHFHAEYRNTVVAFADEGP